MIEQPAPLRLPQGRSVAYTLLHAAPGEGAPNTLPTLLFSALDIALQCTLAKLPETILMAAFDELYALRENFVSYQTNQRIRRMQILLYICAGIIALLICIIGFLAYFFSHAITGGGDP